MSHRLSNKDVDEMVRTNYEEALADGEPWAVDSYEFNHPEATDGDEWEPDPQAVWAGAEAMAADQCENVQDYHYADARTVLKAAHAVREAGK